MDEMAPGILGIDQPFGRIGINLGRRTTILERSDGNLTLIAPGRFEPDEVAAIEALGTVDTIVAPSLLHDLDLAQSLEAFPSARLLGTMDYGRKRSIESIDLDSVEARKRLGGEVDVFLVEGMPRANESVLYHAPTGSLIVADLIMNIHDQQGWLGRRLLQWAGTYQKPGCSRLFRFLIKDRVAFRKSVEPLFDLDLERIIVSHGTIIEQDASQALREAVEVVWNS